MEDKEFDKFDKDVLEPLIKDGRHAKFFRYDTVVFSDMTVRYVALMAFKAGVASVTVGASVKDCAASADLKDCEECNAEGSDPCRWCDQEKN